MPENADFDKWWQHWIATVARISVVVKHPASGNKPGDHVGPKLGVLQRTDQTDPDFQQLRSQHASQTQHA